MSIALRCCLMSLSLLSVAACGGSQGAVSSASGEIEEPVDKPATPGPEASGPVVEAGIESRPRRAAASSRAILDFLPSDRSIIIHLSWRAIEASEIFQQYRELFNKSMATQVGYVIDTCGFDPTDELESVTLALGPDPQNGDDMIMAATLRIGRYQVEDCILKTGGKIEEGKYISRGDTYNVHWADESTLLVADKMSGTEIQAALAKGRATNSEAIMEFLRKTDSHAAIWGGGALPASLSSMMGGSGIQMPRGFHLTINAWSGVDAAMGLAFNSEADASSTLSMIKMGINMMGTQWAGGADLSKALQVQQAGSDISIDLVLAAQEVAQIIDASK